jgi:AbrB family looped-hinge helix DNA binding protein
MQIYITIYRCLLEKTIIILAKTKIGKLNRTTVPERVRKILGLSEGDEVVWMQEGNRIYVENARKEES